MKILITGGAGFIGSNFIHYLIKEYPDYKIINLDALTYSGNLENLKNVESNPNYQFKKFDIRCLNESGGFDKNKFEDELKPLVAESDIIVHFAAESHVDRSVMHDYTKDFTLTNVWGTHILLEAAAQAWKKNDFKEKRFHNISTDEVFGSLGPTDPPFDEKSKYNPLSPYAASKAAADHLVRAYSNTYKIPITISNCSNNYGPYQFPEKVIPLFVTNLIQDKKVPLYGDGLNVRDWIHVDDHSRALDLIIHKGKVSETYFIGGENEVANIDLTKMILEIIGKDESQIEYVKDRPGHDRRYAISNKKIKKELGWQPEILFKEGLKQTIDWYIENKNWWQRIKSGEYLEYYKKQYQER